MLLGTNVLRADVVPLWALLGAYTLQTGQVPPQVLLHTCALSSATATSPRPNSLRPAAKSVPMLLAAATS